MSHLVQGKQVQDLPLLGRNPYALGGLAAGVRTAVGMNDVPVDMVTQASVSINGQRGNQNEFLLDGAPNTGAGVPLRKCVVSRIPPSRSAKRDCPT
jgi:hypothetical protein